jgi:CheY-like chemotaxis protein/anti-anti-sigma regulatory factor
MSDDRVLNQTTGRPEARAPSHLTVSTVIGCTGALDDDHLDELHAILRQQIRRHPDCVFIDLSRASAVGEQALADLTAARAALRTDAGDLFVFAATPSCEAALRAAGGEDLVLKGPGGGDTDPTAPSYYATLPELLGIEAAHGMLAAQLDVGIPVARHVLTSYARHTGQHRSDVASAVTGRSLSVGWLASVNDADDAAASITTLDVLHIEDDASSVKLMQRIFERWPTYTLHSTVTGRAGLDLIQRSQPALLLLDGSLPDLDGSEILSLLRGDPATAEMPIIVMSADASPRRIAELIALGANYYLVKPVDFDRLERLIADLTQAAPWQKAAT